MALGEPYEEYTRLFHYGSEPVKDAAKAAPFLTFVLLLLGKS